MTVRLAAALLPSGQRRRYQEQWLADVQDADEAGLTPGRIARGAVWFAFGSLSRQLLGNEVRASLSWMQGAVGVFLLALIPFVIFVEDQLLGGKVVELRDSLDLFGEFMNSPFLLLTPVLAVLLSCTRLARELGNRFMSSARLRVRTESYLLGKVLVGSGWAFACFFAFTLIAFAVAYVLWPALGNPSIDPVGYNLTAADVVQDSWHRVTYSQLLQLGPWIYGLAYAAWVGFCAANYAALGMACLLIVRVRVLAMAIPFLLFFGQTAAAQLVAQPTWALSFSMIPWGYVQFPIVVGLAPTGILAILTCALWVLLLRRTDRLAALA